SVSTGWIHVRSSVACAENSGTFGTPVSAWMPTRSTKPPSVQVAGRMSVSFDRSVAFTLSHSVDGAVSTLSIVTCCADIRYRVEQVFPRSRAVMCVESRLNHLHEPDGGDAVLPVDVLAVHDGRLTAGLIGDDVTNRVPGSGDVQIPHDLQGLSDPSLDVFFGGSPPRVTVSLRGYAIVGLRDRGRRNRLPDGGGEGGGKASGGAREHDQT